MSDREVTIKIVGKNLTAPEFQAAVRGLGDVRTAARNAGTESDALARKWGQVPPAFRGVQTASDIAAQELERVARAADRFNGDKIINEAHMVVRGVEQIGGAQKLTRAEQDNINRTLGEALQKYGALGQQAPADMRALHAATAPIPQQLSLMQRGADLVKGSFGQMVGAFTLGNLLAGAMSGLAAWTREAITAASTTVNLSNRTKLSTEEIQRMSFVAKSTGSNLEDFTKASFQLGLRLAGGGDSLKEAVAGIGLSFDALRNKKPEEMFRTTIKALEGIEDPAERNRRGVQLFGKAFEQMAGAVDQGYTRLAERAPVMADAQIQALNRATEAWGRFKADTQTTIGAVLSSFVMAGEQASKMGFFDLLKAAAQPGPIVGALTTLSIAQQQPRRDADISLNPKTGDGATDYVAMLASATAAVHGLTAAKRKQLDAALALGEVNDDFLASIGLTDAALKVYTGTTKAHTAETKALEQEVRKVTEARQALFAQAVGDDVIGEAQDYLAALTSLREVGIEPAMAFQQAANQTFLAAADAYARGARGSEAIPPALQAAAAAARVLTDDVLTLKGGLEAAFASGRSSSSILKEYGDQLEVLDERVREHGLAYAELPPSVRRGLDLVQAEWIRHHEAVTANTADFLKTQDTQLADSEKRWLEHLGEMLKAQEAAEQRTAAIRKETEFIVAEAAIAQAKRRGASAREVDALERDLSKKKLDFAIANINKEYEARKKSLDQTVQMDRDTYNTLTEEQKAAVDKLVAQWGAGHQQMEEVTKSFGVHVKEHLLGALADVPTVIKDAFSGQSLERTGKDVGSLVGAAIGAAIGKAIGGFFGGPVGSALLGAAGAAAGNAFAEGFRTDGEDVVRRVGNDWGLLITEEMGNAIAATAHFRFPIPGNRKEGDLAAAEIYHIGGLIKEFGIDAGNVEMFTGKLRDAFVMLGRGTFDAVEATHALDGAFGSLAAHYVEGGGLISAELREIIGLTEQAGLHSKALSAFLREQAGVSRTGLEGILAGNLPGMNEEGLLTGTIDQASFDRLTRLTSASFGAALAAGTPFLEALGSMDAQLDRLKETSDALHLSQTGAFGDLGAIHAFMEANAGVMDSILGTDLMLKGLYNSNRLTQESFDDLGVIAVANFNQMVAGGLTVDQAMTAQQETLQHLWEAWQDGTFAVDEQTRGLLENAEAAGMVGDAQRDAQERSRQAMERSTAAMNRLADTIGQAFGVAGAAVDTFANTAESAIRRTEASVAGLGSRAADSLDQVLAGGLQVDEAMADQQGTLRGCWNVWEDGQSYVADHTRLLLKNADAASLVGESQQDAQEQARLAMVRTSGALGAFSRDTSGAFATAGHAGETFVATVNAALDTIPRRIDVMVYGLYVPPATPGSGGGSSGTRYHQGGLVDDPFVGVVRAHRGLAVDDVPIIAQTGEGILSRLGMSALGGAAMLHRLNAGFRLTGGSQRVAVTHAVTVNIDARGASFQDAAQMRAFEERVRAVIKDQLQTADTAKRIERLHRDGLIRTPLSSVVREM